MKKYIFILSFFLFLTSCGSSSTPQDLNTDSSSGNTTTETGANSENVQAPLTDTGSGTNSEYTLFFDGTGSKTVDVYHTQEQDTMIYFINSDATSMNVKISFPDGETGNLRLTQIIMPDGTMD